MEHKCIREGDFSEVKAGLKHLHERVDKMEQKTEAQYKMSEAIAILAENSKHISDDLKEVKGDVATVKKDVDSVKKQAEIDRNLHEKEKAELSDKKLSIIEKYGTHILLMIISAVVSYLLAAVNLGG